MQKKWSQKCTKYQVNHKRSIKVLATRHQNYSVDEMHFRIFTPNQYLLKILNLTTLNHFLDNSKAGKKVLNKMRKKNE